MAKYESVPGLVSEETFDTFITSKWPGILGDAAYYSNTEGIRLDLCLPGVEVAILTSPLEEREMLAEMGIIEQGVEPFFADGTKNIRFTKLGKKVVMACEGLYTPDEYDARDNLVDQRMGQQRLAYLSSLDMGGNL